MRLLAVILLISFFISGCSVVDKGRALMTLKRLGDSQEQMERYVQRQDELFQQLVKDIEEGRLKTGLSIDAIKRTYGEPVLTRKAQKSDLFETVLLYRHPTRYFNTDRVYLQFDSSGILVGWEYKPYE